LIFHIFNVHEDPCLEDYLQLLCSTLPYPKRPAISEETSRAVARVVTGIVATGLWQCHSCGYSRIQACPAPVCTPCSSKVDMWKTEVGPCYSIAPGPALAEYPERIKFRMPLVVFRCRCHIAPVYLTRDLHWAADNCRQRLWSSANPQADCATYTMPHCWWSSILCRCSWFMKQYATCHLLCDSFEHFQEASQDTSLPVVIQSLTFCFNCFTQLLCFLAVATYSMFSLTFVT